MAHDLSDEAEFAAEMAKYLTEHPRLVQRERHIYYNCPERGAEVLLGRGEALGGYLKAVCRWHGKRCQMFLKPLGGVPACQMALRSWLCLGYEEKLSRDAHYAAGQRARRLLEARWAAAHGGSGASSSTA